MTRANPRLRLARARQGLSQRELARRAGVSVHTVVRAELGKVNPHPISAWRIAQALEVPVEEIFPEYRETS